jgi:uncharacterized membrane protein YbhN (UPF0104 family)
VAAGSGAASGRRRRKVVLAWLISIGLLAWVLKGVDWAGAWRARGELPAWALVLAALGWLGSYLLRAMRLRAEWRAVAPRPLSACLRLVLVHNAWLALLPLRAGEASYVWLVHRFWGVTVGDAARSLLRLRAQDALILLSLGTMLLVPWARVIPLTASSLGGGAASATWGVAVMLASGLVVLLGGALAWHLLQHGSGRLLSRLARRSAAFDALRQGDGRRRALHEGAIYSLLNWLLRLMVVGGLLTALTGLDPALAGRAALGTELGAALPLQGPAGLGPYEAGAWAALALQGQDPSRAMAAVIGVHVFCLLVGLTAAALAQWLLPSPEPSRR